MNRPAFQRTQCLGSLVEASTRRRVPAWCDLVHWHLLHLFVACLGMAACDLRAEAFAPLGTQDGRVDLVHSVDAQAKAAGSAGLAGARVYGAPLSRRPKTVTLDRQGLRIDGHYTWLRGGSVQWFRIPEAAWEDRLRRYAAAGFNALDIYIAWNVIEPTEGEFNFAAPDLRRFLELCQQYGLWVVVRPGPFITNEMDGGGLPAWLLRSATKQSLDADGLFNIRTDDPDFMAATARYLGALGEVLSPYFATRGGPVVLYGIENEYTWFEVGFKLDHLFRDGAGLERPLGQRLNVAGYMRGLRDIVVDAGCDVPIFTSPGDGRISATGKVPGVVPFPSVYEWATPKQPEDAAFDLLQDMHDPAAYGGVYNDMPSGSSELTRSAQQFRRFFSGGFDALFAFNLVGLIQEGYLNSVTLAARYGDQPPHWGPPGAQADDWVGTVFDFGRPERAFTGFASPDFGYFHNVLDYRGAMSPSGAARKLFHQYHRDNLFFDSVEGDIAPLERPHRTGNVPDHDPALVVSQPALGVLQHNGPTHYWFRANHGGTLLSLVNQTGQPQTLLPDSLRMYGEQFPRFSTATVPVADEPGLTYAQMLLQNWPLTTGLRLAYTTSEMLTLRDFGPDRLLVLYGAEGSTGELALRDAGGALGLEFVDAGMTVHESGATLTVSYPHAGYRFLVLRTTNGQRLAVLVTTREAAGRFWFRTVDGADVLVCGPHLVDLDASGFEVTGREGGQLWVVSPRALELEGIRLARARHPITGAAMYTLPQPKALPELTARIDRGRAKSDLAEAQVFYDDAGWQSFYGEPAPMEDADIFRGHAWYRTEFDWPGAFPWFDRGHLRIEHAADFVGIYINGRYMTTLAPAGTEIDSGAADPNYRFPSLKPYLKQGKNVLAFRTESWGHGSFMFGRGRLLGTRAQLPSVGYEGLKGLYGRSRLGGVELTRWKVRAELGGERAGYFQPGYDDSDWQPAGVPFELAPGDVRWFRTRFFTSDLPSAEAWFAPVAAQLSGRQSKATLFLNGRLIGRWLSDDDWLQRGVWAQPIRNMWNDHNSDHFPLPRELLFEDGRENVLAIAFEDASEGGGPPGKVDKLELGYNRERADWNGESFARGVAASYRYPLSWRATERARPSPW